MNMFEQTKSSPENPEEALEKSRETIERLKREEQEQGKIALAEVDPKKLTQEDLKIWGKIEDETIIQEEMARYMNSLLDEGGRVREGVSPNRIDFMAFANSKAGIVILKREMNKENT